MDILEFNINYQLILSVIGTILAVLLVFLILQFFWLRAKVNRLYRKYKYFMMGEDGGSIEMKSPGIFLTLLKQTTGTSGYGGIFPGYASSAGASGYDAAEIFSENWFGAI